MGGLRWSLGHSTVLCNRLIDPASHDEVVMMVIGMRVELRCRTRCVGRRCEVFRIRQGRDSLWVISNVLL